MSTPNSELDRLRRREHLLLRSRLLRAELSLHAQALHKPFGLADQARRAVDWMGAHPQWPLGALVVVAVLRPRRVLGWAGTLWWGFGLFKRARALLVRL